MFAGLVQITAKSGQGPYLSQHIRDRTINVLKRQRDRRGGVRTPSARPSANRVAKNLTRRAMLMTLCAARLRRSEPCHLKVTDIDSQRMVIPVNQAKGARDYFSWRPDGHVPFQKDRVDILYHRI